MGTRMKVRCIGGSNDGKFIEYDEGLFYERQQKEFSGDWKMADETNLPDGVICEKYKFEILENGERILRHYYSSK